MNTPAEMRRIAGNLEHISKHSRAPEIALLKWGARRIETLERRLAKRHEVRTNGWKELAIRKPRARGNAV